MANLRSRIRMANLYVYASNNQYLVAGTGNKVEDFGVGFYTKYGDGGVDISPIADLMKSEVFSLAKILNIVQSIQDAAPTDGLWDDDRSDEEQLGATYDELEWAMNYAAKNLNSQLTSRQKVVLEIYKRHHEANAHKMIPIPVCKIPLELQKV
jgi:NAD+ synthase